MHSPHPLQFLDFRWMLHVGLQAPRYDFPSFLPLTESRERLESGSPPYRADSNPIDGKRFCHTDSGTRQSFSSRYPLTGDRFGKFSSFQPRAFYPLPPQGSECLLRKAHISRPVKHHQSPLPRRVSWRSLRSLSRVPWG